MRKGIGTIFISVILAGVTLILPFLSSELPKCAHTAEVFVDFTSPTYQMILEESNSTLDFLEFRDFRVENSSVVIERNDGKMLLKYRSDTDLKAFLGCKVG